MSLSLIKTDYEPSERRKLPRFPFCFLLFMPKGEKSCLEVSDISQTGMQLVSKQEEIAYTKGQEIEGEINWHGESIILNATVAWVHANRAGLRFSEDEATKTKLDKYFNIDKIIDHLRPLHEQKVGTDLPNNLKVWLKTDGPVELFIWEHNDGEISRFQVLLWDQYLEWEDGRGLITGKIMTSRKLETPLHQESEFQFRLDENSMNPRKRDRVFEFVSRLENLLDPRDLQFLLRKLHS